MEAPWLENIWNKYRGHGVQVVVVLCGSTLANAQNWLTQKGITFPAIHDPSFATMDLYTAGNHAIPHNYIVGRDMLIRKDILGVTSESHLEGSLLDVVHMRKAINVEMVMDVSDSMNSPSPSDPAGDSKLQMLKRTCNIVTDFLNANGQADDRMGLVWFTDNASEYAKPNGEKLLLVQNNASLLKAEIDAHTTGICTAMGAGLQSAFNTLSAKPDGRFAVLCTDGMQNIEPKIANVGGHYEIIDSGGWLCGGHSSTPPSPGTDIKQHKTRVHTIGIGVEANYSTLLQDVANVTGGFYRGTNDPETDLDLIYLVDLCNCMAGASPAVVLHSPAKLDAKRCTTEEYFSLNRSARKMTVVLSWKKVLNGSLTFWLYAPDGTLLDLHQEMEIYDTYVMATLFLPKQQDGKTLPHVGQWRMVIAGQFPGSFADYHATVIAEDNQVKYKLDYPRKIYSVGDVFPLHIQLMKSAIPITQINEISVETTHLGKPVPELLSEYRMVRKAPAQKTRSRFQEHLMDPLTLKLNAMMADKRFQERLKPVRKQLSLKGRSLKAEFKEKEIRIPIELKMPGLHTFKVAIQAKSRETGPVQRVDLVSVIVDPGMVDPKHSVVSQKVPSGKQAGALFRITPKNDRGQMLGPGQARDVSVSIGGRSLKINVEDLLDGTYQVVVPLSEKERAELREKKVRVSIGFRNRSVWERAI